MKYKAVAKKVRARQHGNPLAWVAGAMYVALPLVVSVSGLDKFRVPKDVFVVLAVLLMVGVALITRPIGVPRRLDLWNWLLLGGTVYILLHSLLVGSHEESLPAFFSMVWYIVLLLLLVSVGTEDSFRRIWLAAGLALSVNAILTTLQYYGQISFMEGAGGQAVAGRVTPAGLIGEVNSGGFLFALMCVISLYGIALAKETRERLLWMAIFGFNLLGLTFTRTLTALAGFSVCMLLWIIFHHWWVLRNREGGRRQLLVFWLALLVGGALGGVAAQRAGVFTRMILVAGQASRGNWDAATAGRQPVYQITWQMILKDPVAGRGLNSFGRTFFFERTDTDFGQSVKMISQAGAFRQVHNEYLQAWVELGLLGLLFLVALGVLPLFWAARRLFHPESPEQAYWAGILILSWLLILISSITFFPFHVSVTAAFSMLVLASLRSFRPRGSLEVIELESRIPARLREGWIRIVLVCALLFPLGSREVRKWLANHEMGVSSVLLENARNSTSNPRQSRVFADEALHRLDRADRYYGGFAEIRNLRGTALILLGRTAEATEAYLKAAERLPSPEVFTNASVALLAEGQEKKARSLLQMALRYNPDFEPARNALDLLEKGRR